MEILARKLARDLEADSFVGAGYQRDSFFSFWHLLTVGQL